MINRILAALLATQLLLSCSGGGGNSCNNSLNSSYLQEKLNSDSFYQGVTILESKLIHDDGNQGAVSDIDRIVLSRVSAEPLGDTLAFSYSGFGNEPDYVLHAALYIDADSDLNTGQIVGDIGADILLVDAIVYDRSLPAPVYSWDNTNKLWLDRTGPVTGSGQSYQCGYGKRFQLAWSSVLTSETLNLSQARGIMKLLTYDSNNPNNGLISESDTTASFSFSFP